MGNIKEVFLRNLAKGELWLQYCKDCGKYLFYPRPLCPGCFKPDLEWRKTSGKGKVYSFTTVNYSNLPEMKDRVPYTFAMVELQEGVRLATNIIGCQPADVEVDMPVEMVVKQINDQPLAYFKPQENI